MNIVFLTISFVAVISPKAPSTVSYQQKQELPEVQAAARKEITAGYAAWGKARLAFDVSTYQKMLAPDFYAQLSDKKLSREEFIGAVSTKNPRVTLKRFDSQIICLTKTGDQWLAVITEKLEVQGKSKDGKDIKYYNVWVTKDGWRKSGDKWTICSTEEIGSEYWLNQEPPIPHWRNS